MVPPKRLGRLVTNSVWNLASYVATTVVGVISVPLYIHFLGVGRYGLMVLLSSILAPMGLLNLGFGQATVKYVAESMGRNDSLEAETYLRTTLLFNAFIGVLGTLIIAALAGFLSTRVFRIDAADQSMAQVAFLWIALGWLVNQVSATYMSVPTALQRYNWVAVGGWMTTTGSALSGLLVLVLGGDLLLVIQARFVWSLLILAFWALASRRLMPRINLLPGWNSAAFRRSINFGVWQTLATVGGLCANQTDRYVLGAYLSTTAVGMYNIALTVEQTVYGAIYKIGDVLFPAISEMEGGGRTRQAKALMLRSSWLLSSLTVVFLGPAAIFAHDILRLYVGADIADSVSWLLEVLVIAGILSSGSVSMSNYILGTGRTRWLAITSFASGLVILAGGLLLVPRLGLAGAGWMQILAILLTRPVIHLFMWRKMLRSDVSLRVFLGYLYGPAFSGSLLVFTLSLVRNAISFQAGWTTLIAGMIIAALLLLVGLLACDRLMPATEERREDVRTVLIRLQQRRTAINPVLSLLLLSVRSR